MIRLSGACFGVLFLALLTGCTGNPVSPASRTSDLEQKAVAIISVSHDIGAKNGANAIFYLDGSRYPGRVVMKSVQDNLSIPVQSEFAGRRGHLYVLELEPGTHSIDGWQVSSAGMQISSRIAPMQFEVKRGEVLYLGNLHAKLELGHGTFFGGRAASDAMPVVFDQHDEDVALAEARVPALKGRVRVALLKIGSISPVGESSKRFDPGMIPPVPVK